MSFPIKGQYGPLLIAEIGGNHEGDFEYAKELIQLAIDSKADCIKLQVYSGDTLVSEVESPDRNKHFKKFEFTVPQYIELIDQIKKAGRYFTASVWDVELIEALDAHIDFYKIGSGDLTALPLLKYIAQKDKPIILSTGLSTEQEVVEAVKFMQTVNPRYLENDGIAILQCTSMYPIKDEDANLAVMDQLKREYGFTVGYSDHTIGTEALKYAIIKGAEVVEFHFTDQKEGRDFRDHQVSLTKEDVWDLIDAAKAYAVFNGSGNKVPMPIEIENNHVVTFRRAVYPARDIEPGEVLQESDLVVLRPNHGVDARNFYAIIGKRVCRKLYRHKAFSLEDLE